LNAKRKLQNQVKSLQDTGNDSWINDKYFFEHVAKEKEEKEKSESSEKESLVFEDFGSDSEPGIGPPKILSKKIKKAKKEKKEKKDKKKKKKKKKDRKEKKSKREKSHDEDSD